MRICRFVAVLVLGIAPLAFMGCATSVTTTAGMNGIVDDAYDADVHMLSQTGAALDAPFNGVGAAWNDPQTEFPFYLTSIADPYNYPHLLWRAFYTVWTVPLNPLYHVTSEPTDDWDSYVTPIRETVSYDFSPTPHGGDGTKYFTSRFNSHVKHFKNIGESFKYHLLNTNSMLPPYDRFYPEVWQRDKTTLHKTFDLHLFRYDWDDPYVD